VSYDIWFCHQSNEKVDRSKLRWSLAALPNTTESESDDGKMMQFQYENPETGVYCLFDFYDPAAAEGIELPSGFAPAGLSVSINYLRPRFFAAELMPMIAGIAETNKILVVDPQEDNPVPEAPDAATLIERWITSNERVTRGMAMQEDQPIIRPYLSPEESMRWWEYSRAKMHLQDVLGEEIFVPSIRFGLDSQKRVHRVVQWSMNGGALPQVFPPCDHLLLAWDFDPDQQRKPKLRAVRMEAADRLQPLLEPIDGPVSGLMVLRPTNQADATRVFEGLTEADAESLDFIASDGFVDVLV
jgi:hypothetical protein